MIDKFDGRVRRLETESFANPAWSPDGRKIAADGIRVLDLRSGRVTRVHPAHSPGTIGSQG